MPFNVKHMPEALPKRKGVEGSSGSLWKKKATKKDKLKASTLLPQFLMVGLEASRAFGATTQ